jgi:hypothetical protein
MQRYYLIGVKEAGYEGVDCIQLAYDRSQRWVILAMLESVME